MSFIELDEMRYTEVWAANRRNCGIKSSRRYCICATFSAVAGLKEMSSYDQLLLEMKLISLSNEPRQNEDIVPL